jgi:hypothetical protein
LYLKRANHGSNPSYFLCESYRSGGCWKYRVLVALGSNPEEYIEYPGGNSFYVRESLEEELRRVNPHYSSRELEALLLPFVDPSIRSIIEQFQRPGTRKTQRNSTSSLEMLERQRELNSFDKRRLHYLRFGRVHIGNLEAKPWTFLNVLLDKSRDEIESLLGEMEWDLPPQENRRYLYTAFGLERHFRDLLTRYQPEALDPFRVEECFLEDLCRLNRDEPFFRGVDDHDLTLLHPYLRKYVILYFDSTFDPQMVWDEDGADFVRRRQFSQGSGAFSGPVSGQEKEACRSLGIAVNDFQKMNRQELIRAYRKLAMKFHPDVGGDKEAFVEVKAAYECLLKRKG